MTLRYLFIHQNMPGQFPHLASKLAEDPANTVYFLTRLPTSPLPGVRAVRYRLRPPAGGEPHRFLRNMQNGVLHGEAVARAVLNLEKQHDFRPDFIYAHPGWGETLFLKEILPDVPLLHYCEFYYHTLGADAFFSLDETPSIEDHMRMRIKNGVNLVSLDICDAGITPTEWQLRQNPPQYRQKISVIHDGIDANRIRPDPSTVIGLPDGSSVRFGDEVVTYVNRQLEPFRGLFTFVEAAELVARKRPDCRFLVIGAETGRYYGARPPKGTTFKEMALKRLQAARDRVLFLGRLPHAQYLKVLQASAAHVYLTQPFVLSWSMLEAMAAGCLVIGSATPPVAEVIEDDQNGLLVDFFSSDELAERIEEALEDRSRMSEIRAAARHTVLERYALDKCLPRQLELIQTMLSGKPLVGRTPQPQPVNSMHDARRTMNPAPIAADWRAEKEGLYGS